MPITLRPTAGTKVYVSAGTPGTINAAGYAALTWTEVQGFSNVGEIGDMMDVGNFDSLTEGRIKYRSISDPGQLDASMADMPSDAGQIILKTAFAAGRGAAGETISLRIEDASGKGTYARVQVAGWRRVFGGAADVQMRNATLPIIAGTIVEY
jgi:hypothetical protein